MISPRSAIRHDFISEIMNSVLCCWKRLFITIFDLRPRVMLEWSCVLSDLNTSAMITSQLASQWYCTILVSFIKLARLQPRDVLTSSLTMRLAVCLVLFTIDPFFLACAQPSPADLYFATETPIAKAGLLANIGPSGAKSQGAKAGIVIASPSSKDPDYLYTWTRDSSLVFQAIIDQYAELATCPHIFLRLSLELLWASTQAWGLRLTILSLHRKSSSKSKTLLGQCLLVALVNQSIISMKLLLLMGGGKIYFIYLWTSSSLTFSPSCSRPQRGNASLFVKDYFILMI